MKTKKCPPGIMCIESYSMIFVGICLAIFLYILFVMLKPNQTSEKIIIKDNVREPDRGGNKWFNALSWPYTNLPSDPLLNPYAPPLRDERYLVPINVSTNVGAVDAPYRQLGILTATNTKNKIMPLMGRPLFTNRDKWQYYTMTSDSGIKLPVSRSGKSCTNEYGCDKLYNGDTVYVEGLNEPFRLTIYDNDTIRYLPFY